MRKIKLLPHDHNWSKLFQTEAETLTGVFGREILAVHHIGSTAIPGICAKPIVDILVEARDIESIDRFDAAMIDRGYRPQGEFGITGRRFFIKGDDDQRTHHVHAFQAGNPEMERHLNFRDYMIAHPEDAQAYGRLKQELARRFPEDIESYTEGKDEFIKEVNKRAKTWKRNHARKNLVL